MDPKYVDVHAHVNFKAFAEDRDEVIQRALDAGGIEMLGATLSNAQRLHAAGVLIGFEGNGPERERELRHNAGAVVAEGLPYAAALAAITINPARIFGLADRVGSLEPGKEGDAVIWDGDPLETTSRPVAIFIRGIAQPMTSRQTELRDRYIQQVRKPQ